MGHNPFSGEKGYVPHFPDTILFQEKKVMSRFFQNGDTYHRYMSPKVHVPDLSPSGLR
jgi:hypothetical protein